MAEHFDVLVVGAGLSGIGAACHLQEKCPGKRYVILEARGATGGTWDLFRYPGVRSDSDMFTLGYAFRPWRGEKAIVEGPEILSYLRETAAQYGVDRHIRLRHRVKRASWSSADSRWTVEAEVEGKGAVSFTCGFLFMCSGYYSYDEGYSPEFPGIDRFGGRVIHPQHWPEDLDYAGKRVVVIGSGATAVTLVPAMAETAGHVTMLQRSPTYVVSIPGEDPIANLVRRLLPEKAAYAVVRWKNVLLQMAVYKLSKRRPKLVRNLIRKGTIKALPEGYEVDKHFKPRYDPWDQRLCAIPDGDLFEAISDGRAEIVTDRIETFTEGGVKLESGKELEADIVITATGLNLLFLGGMEISLDGEELDVSERMTYKGMLLSDVPNLAFTLGYSNASWTLKADLTSEYVCRLLNHMDEHGYSICVPRANGARPSEEPLVELTSGYVLRSIDSLPKQGPCDPWQLKMNYAKDLRALRHGPLVDSAMEFSTPAPEPEPAEPAIA
jgi:cation diffusion facilitator CzcD-associated flavoprotein CzcO